MKTKTAIFTIAAAVLSAIIVSSAAQASGSVYKFQQHAKNNIAAVWLAKGKKDYPFAYAWGWARGENADAQARENCKKHRNDSKTRRCKRLSFGGAKCFALYIRPHPHKFRYSLARGKTEKDATSTAYRRCGKQCKREIVSCADNAAK